MGYCFHYNMKSITIYKNPWIFSLINLIIFIKESLSMEEIIYLACFLILCFIALWDFLYYEIPNSAVLALIALYPFYGFYFGPPPLVDVIVFGVPVLIFSIIAFRYGWWGGGDVKLMAALIPYVSEYSVLFIVYTTTMGGILGVLQLIWSRELWKVRKYIHKKVKVSKRQKTPVLLETAVPYGIAIALAAILVF